LLLILLNSDDIIQPLLFDNWASY